MTTAELASLHPNHVYGLAVSPDFQSTGSCFAACASGLRRSEDCGQTLVDAYAGMDWKQPLACTSVVVSPDYMEDRTLFTGALGGVLRSIDGGSYWSVATLPTPPPFVVDLALSPNFRRDGLVFAATMEDGVFRSWDRGASWASWNFGLLDLNVFCLAISSDFGADETLFAGTESGVFRSANGGRAWRETPFPMAFAPVLRLAVSPRFGVDGVLFAGTESHGVWRSDDGGASWSPVEEGPSDSINDLKVMAAEDEDALWVFALSGSSLYWSRDGGREWFETTLHEAGACVPTCIVATSGHGSIPLVLVGMDDGRVISLDMSTTSQ